MKPCNLGVGCEEYGVCYASANERPDMCGLDNEINMEQTNELLEIDKHLIERDRKAGDWINTIISGFGDDNSRKVSFLMMFASTGASQMADAYGLPDPVKYLEFCTTNGGVDFDDKPTYLAPLRDDTKYQQLLKDESGRIIQLA